MIHVEIETTIDRSIEDVFERLVDIPRYPEWMPDGGLFIHCTQDSDGPVGPGTEYTDVTRLGTAKGRVVELDPPRRVVFEYVFRLFGRMVMRGRPAYDLERAGDGTRVHHQARGRLFGVFRLFRPVVQKIAESERSRTVRALERSLETEPGNAPDPSV